MNSKKNIPTEQLKNILEAKSIESSFHRISVLKYIMEQENHPSVDVIYKTLIEKIPTLSKTTVYNTLKHLAEKEIINALTIDDVEVRYDFNDRPHAQYKLDIRKLYSYLRVS